MPALTSTVDLIFRGENRVSPAVRGVLRDVDNLGVGMVNLARPIALATGALLALEAAAAAVVIKFGSSALSAFASYEEALIGLTKVAGDLSQEQLTELRRELGDLAVEFGVAGSDAVAAAADWVKAGKDVSDSIDLVRLSLEFARAADIDSAEATKTLKVISEAYGFTVEELRKKLDFLNTVSDNSATSVPQLADAIASAAGTAALAGLSFEELTAFITPAAAKTQEFSEIGRAVRTVLSNLIDPTGKQSEALALLGINTDSLAFKSQSAGEKLFQFLGAVTNTDERTREFAVAAIAGADQLSRIGAAALGTAQTQSILNGEFKNVITVAEEASRTLGTQAGKVDQLNSAYGRFLTAVGEQLSPEFRGVVDAIKQIFITLESEVATSGGLDALFEAIGPQLEQLERLALEIAAAIPAAFEQADFSGFSDGIEALFGDLKNISISSEDLADLFTGIAETFETLSGITAAFGEALGGVAAVIGPLITGFADLDDDTQRLVGTTGAAAIGITALSGVVGGLLGALRTLISIGGSAGALLTALGSVSAIQAVATSLGGIVTLVGGLTFSLASLTGANSTLNDILAPDALFGEGATLGTVGFFDPIFQALEALGILGESTSSQLDKAVTGVTEMQVAVDTLDVSQATDGLGGFAEELDQLLFGLEDQADVFDEINDTINKMVIGYSLVTESIDESVDQWNEQNDAIEKSQEIMAGVRQTVVDGVVTYVQFGKSGVDANTKVANAVEKLEGDTEKALDRAASLHEKMLEIASDERLAVIEANVKINVAQIEADAKTTVAAFESIASTVDSITSALPGLFGAFNAASAFDQLFIQDTIEQQLRLQELSVLKQGELIDAQIELLRERARALKRGDMEIKITADGLDPALDLVLRTILDRAQITTAAENAEFLVAIT